jgi:hypothetical protein
VRNKFTSFAQLRVKKVHTSSEDDSLKARTIFPQIPVIHTVNTLFTARDTVTHLLAEYLVPEYLN